MNDKGQTAPLALNQNDDPARNPAAHDGSADIEDRPADFTTGLANLGFIRAALRRSARTWCACGLLGFLAGFGVFVGRPAGYQASTSVLLPPGSYQGAILDDQAIAHSRAVAAIALRTLGSRQSPASFVGDYTVAAPTSRVLVITASATSNDASVREANALAAAYLAFQAHLLRSQEQLLGAALQQQVTQAEQHLNSISKRIGPLSSQPASPAARAELTRLRAERSQAESQLVYVKQANYGAQASTRAATASQLKGSTVLDTAVPIKHSRTKRLLLYAGGGLLAGLVLGLGIVVIRALVSDRLRQRDDVARAIGAQVRLSVGKVRLSRLRSGRRGLAAVQSPEVRRIVTHLDNVMPSASRRPASLAVVPVDDMQVPAVCLASLAVSHARRGSQVVVADLCSGAPVARLLGAAGPGVATVDVDGAHLVVAVPEADEVAPSGPLQRRSRRTQSTEPLAAACASADLLLTLAALDPSLGSEHLATWANAAVAMVTAGKSSAARVNAVGEMIRLARTPLISVVLVGADKSDESLGMTHMSAAGREAETAKESLGNAEASFVSVGQTAEGR